MTSEEAIDLLDNLNGMIEDSRNSDYDTAFKMAIKALEQEPCEDCISRQAAIDAIMANNIWENEYNLTSSRIKKAVEALPPVTPQCKSEDVAKAFQLGLAFGFGEKYDEMDKVMEEVKKAVTPQPKTGWIPVSERPPETDDEVIAYDGADAFVAWYGVNGWHSTDNRFDPRVPIIEWKPINLPKAEEKTNDSCWKEYYESKFMKKV